MRAPLVFRSAEPSDPHDQQLADARLERRLQPDVLGQQLPRRVHLRMLSVGAIHGGGASAGSVRIEHRPDLRRPLRGVERVDPRLFPHQPLAVPDDVDPVRDSGGQMIRRAGFSLNANRVDDLGKHREFRDGKHGIHHLMRVIARRERTPGLVAHEGIDVQLVCQAKQHRFKRVPAALGRTGGNPSQLVAADARLVREPGVPCPLVVGVAQPRRAQNQELAVTRGQRRVTGYVVGERHDALHQVGVVEERPLVVRRRILARIGLHQPAVHVGPRRFRKWLNPRRRRHGCHPHRSYRQRQNDREHHHGSTHSPLPGASCHREGRLETA